MKHPVHSRVFIIAAPDYLLCTYVSVLGLPSVRSYCVSFSLSHSFTLTLTLSASLSLSLQKKKPEAAVRIRRRDRSSLVHTSRSPFARVFHVAVWPLSPRTCLRPPHHRLLRRAPPAPALPTPVTPLIASTLPTLPTPPLVALTFLPLPVFGSGLLCAFDLFP